MAQEKLPIEAGPYRAAAAAIPALKAGRAARDSIMATGIEMSGDGDSRVVVLHCCLC